jgi:lipopolysaccharide biosynthesis protein
MVMKKKVAVLYHIFYEDTIDHIEEQLKPLNYFDPFFFFNISVDTPDQSKIRECLSKDFPGVIITSSSNKGKDIGAKLLLLSACIQFNLKPDWFVFLHDKKSLQALNARTWKNDLFKIIDESSIEAVDKVLSNPTTFGIIATENYVQTEKKQNGKFASKNGQIMDELVLKYKISCENFSYVAGTMFWAKADVLLDFFNQNDPLEIRQSLENGNVLDNFSGTYTHSWERMLSWIILSGGLTIKTI